MELGSLEAVRLGRAVEKTKVAKVLFGCGDKLTSSSVPKALFQK